jgi:hypothetical protein
LKNVGCALKNEVAEVVKELNYLNEEVSFNSKEIDELRHASETSDADCAEDEVSPIISVKL